MAKVVVTVDELSSTPVTVTAGDRTETLQPQQSRNFEGSSISISDATPAEDAPAIANQPPDVFQHNNPNGITRAEIAPKLPKAAGELVQRTTEDGRTLEEALPDPTGLATAGGGPEGAESGKTPGPAPDGRGVGGATASGARPTGAESGPSPALSKENQDLKQQRAQGPAQKRAVKRTTSR